jgi:hypothetical protein
MMYVSCVQHTHTHTHTHTHIYIYREREREIIYIKSMIKKKNFKT